MHTTRRIFVLIGFIILLLVVWFIFPRNTQAPAPQAQVLSYADCVRAGYPIKEMYPRQCTTPDGRTYAEEKPQQATYINTTADTVVFDVPFPGAVVGKKFLVKGTARGTWFFEASFPVEVLDKNGKRLASVPAQAQGEWMTEGLVPFSASISIPETYTGPATLVLHKDNPSGLPKNDASVSFPIVIQY